MREDEAARAAAAGRRGVVPAWRGRLGAPLPARAWAALAALAALLLLALWGAYANTPFSRVPGQADYIGNENGRIALNYLRYGLAATKGAQIRNLEPAPPEDWVHYQMHPATVDLLTAGVFRLAGSRAPWVHRLLPGLATALASWLLVLVARAARLPVWPALFLFSVFPITGVHGLNLSYEPFCLAWLLGIVLAYQKGLRFGLAPLFVLGGLFDYPVLYLAPFLALHALTRPRASPPALSRRLAFGGVLALACVLSLGLHIAHTVFALGDLQGGAGNAFDRYLVEILTAKRWMPAAGAFLAQQVRYFGASFTVLGVALAALGSFVHRRRLELPELAFLFTGAVHLLVFRGHAMLHDFWLVYFTPFLALAGARLLATLPAALAVVLAAGLGLLGGWSDLAVWRERAAPDVRGLGRELAALFPGEVVLHAIATPAPWALETWRGHPVADGSLVVRGLYFPMALDRLAEYGYLGRPQKAVLPLEDLEPGWLDMLHGFLPGLPEQRVRGRLRTWLVQDWTRVFSDPGAFPPLAAKLREAGRDPAALARRARRLAAALSIRPGARLWFLDGAPSAPERFRRRTIRGIAPADLDRPEAARAWIAAWPRSPQAALLAARYGRDLGQLEVRFLGRLFRLPARAPRPRVSLR